MPARQEDLQPVDAAPLTGYIHSAPAAGACQQAAACKALERGMRESMPAAATCRGAGALPQQAAGPGATTILRLSEKSHSVSQVAHAQLSSSSSLTHCEA